MAAEAKVQGLRRQWYCESLEEKGFFTGVLYIYTEKERGEKKARKLGNGCRRQEKMSSWEKKIINIVFQVFCKTE